MEKTTVVVVLVIGVRESDGFGHGEEDRVWESKGETEREGERSGFFLPFFFFFFNLYKPVAAFKQTQLQTC